jgi:hypothetical protein
VSLNLLSNCSEPGCSFRALGNMSIERSFALCFEGTPFYGAFEHSGHGIVKRLCFFFLHRVYTRLSVSPDFIPITADYLFSSLLPSLSSRSSIHPSSSAYSLHTLISQHQHIWWLSGTMPAMVRSRGSQDASAPKKHARRAFSLMSLGTRTKGYIYCPFYS